MSPVLQPENEDNEVLDPDIVRTKGCGSISTGRRKRTQTCSLCGVAGHNKRCCPHLTLNIGGHTLSPINSEEETEEDVNYNYNSQTVCI